MFLDEFEPAEQQAFLSLAKSMVAADGVVAPEEQQMLEDALREMALDPATPITESEFESACAAVSVPTSRAFMLLELASFALVDGDYADHEQTLFRSIASFWNVDPMTVIRIEAWAQERIRMSMETASLIQEIVEPLRGAGADREE